MAGIRRNMVAFLSARLTTRYYGRKRQVDVMGWLAAGEDSVNRKTEIGNRKSEIRNAGDRECGSPIWN